MSRMIKTALSLILISGCAYASKGAVVIKASKVDATLYGFTEKPQVVHSWTRCFGIGCDWILNQMREDERQKTISEIRERETSKEEKAESITDQNIP